MDKTDSNALTEKVDNLHIEDFETTTLAEQHGEQIEIDHGKGKNVAEDQEDATEDEFYDSHEYTTEELEVSIGLHHVGITALDVTLTVACMSAQKRMIREANECKVAGNEFFAKAQYDEAIAKYEDALMACPERSTQERAIYFANIAACQMKQNKYAEARDSCTKAIELYPKYSKALFRRAQAEEKIRTYTSLTEALKDYQGVREMDDITDITRRECLKAEQRLPSIIKAQGEKEKEEMMGKLKDLGNTLLGKFGLSTDNFQMQKDPTSGNYSVNFVNKN
ncbi:Cytochrome c oxidase subunit 1 [Umbelopsis nana]